MPLAALAIGAVTSLVGAKMQSGAAKKAAAGQASAAEKASADQAATAKYSADLQKKAADEALAFQREQYYQGMKNMQPWLQTGTAGLSKLSSLMGLRPGNTATQIPGGPGATVGAPAPAGSVPPVVDPAQQQKTAAFQQYMTQKYPDWKPQPGAQGFTPDEQATLKTEWDQFNQQYQPQPGTSTVTNPDGSQTLITNDPAQQQPGTVDLQPAGGEPGAGGEDADFGSLMANWEDQFTAPEGAPGQFVAPGGAPGEFVAPEGAPGQFEAPTAVTMENDPGYQFRLEQAKKALERSAAARGTLLTGGTAKALGRYMQDYASGEFQNVYNRALGTQQQKQADFANLFGRALGTQQQKQSDFANLFGRALGTQQQQQSDFANRYGRALGEFQQKYNIFNQNQTNRFNRLSAISGVGQTAAQNLNSAGQQFANQAGDITTNTAGRIGNIYGQSTEAQNTYNQNAAAARGSGYVAGANAWAQGIGGLGSNLGKIVMFDQFNKKKAPAPAYQYPTQGLWDTGTG